MSQFVYLYRGAERGRSPEKMQEMMQKWMTWMKQLTEKGHIKDPGQPLEHTGKLVKGKQKTVTDGPFAEAKEVVAGFYIIDVASEEEAIEWAKRCPIDVALGPGMETIFEVRQVADVPDEDMTPELASEMIGGTIS